MIFNLNLVGLICSAAVSLAIVASPNSIAANASQDKEQLKKVRNPSASGGTFKGDIATVVHLIDGLRSIRESRDMFASDAEMKAKEDTLVRSILRDHNTLTFEFQSIPGDQSQSIPTTGASWSPSTYYAKYDVQSRQFTTPPSLSSVYVNSLNHSPIIGLGPHDKVSVVDVWERAGFGRSYTAHNGYGASITVETHHSEIWGLIVVDESQRYLGDEKWMPDPVLLEPDEARQAIKRLVWRMTLELVTAADETLKISEHNYTHAATYDDPSDSKVVHRYLPARFLSIQILDPKTSKVFFEYKSKPKSMQ